MTMQSLEQVLTIIHRIQNSVEVIATSQKQSQQEAWKETLDVLTQLVTLVQNCGTREFIPQLQPALSDLQSDLDIIYAECQRRSAHTIKKRGLLRVSAVLPKWVVGKFVGREVAGLREKIRYTHTNFETAVRQLDKGRSQEPSIAGPSGLSQQLTKQTSSPVNIEKRVPTSSKGATYTHILSGVHWGTASSPSRAVETAEIYDEWGTDDPEDWVAILTEMRNNVQDLAGSLLGKVQLGRRDGRVVTSHASNPSGSKGVYSSGNNNLALELRRMENYLLMQITSFTPPDLCSPHDQFQAAKLTPSYPIVVSGHSWDVAVGRATDLFYSLNIPNLDMRSPEAASTLFDLSQALEDLCMHNYSYTVATWALQIRRGLYHSDKDTHRRNLASVLSLKARVLGRLGKIDGAMIAARGAVQLCYEEQVLQGVQLARALHVQASLLNAGGKKSEAKAMAMEMVEILAALGDEKPHLRLFLSLARASLSDLLVDTEEYPDALATVQAAIKSARALIGVVDSRPALAIALLVRARALGTQGERGSAYVAGVQAVRHLRDLTSERPGFSTFLACALVLSSRHLHTAGFYWEARKHAEEAVELYRNLHTSAPQAFARHYAEALGHLVQLRVADENDGEEADSEVFDMAQHAASLFREASVTDSDTLASVLVVVASHLLKARRLQDASASAEEAVGIRRRKWSQNPDQHAPAAFVDALRLASSCFPATEEGLEYAKEAVQVHKERKVLDRDAHQDLLAHLLMDVFSRLTELGRDVEAIPWKTEAAKLNMDLVESTDRPAAHFKGTPDSIMRHGSDTEDDKEKEDT
ncbi:hypothetical protein BJY52DRAFT_1190214 [Lactarius psammicola]|nr:hypothetical protein BJY52DRAFT_1190214 [Lactarius psammicola]